MKLLKTTQWKNNFSKIENPALQWKYQIQTMRVECSRQSRLVLDKWRHVKSRSSTQSSIWRIKQWSFPELPVWQMCSRLLRLLSDPDQYCPAPVPVGTGRTEAAEWPQKRLLHRLPAQDQQERHHGGVDLYPAVLPAISKGDIKYLYPLIDTTTCRCHKGITVT